MPDIASEAATPEAQDWQTEPASSSEAGEQAQAVKAEVLSEPPPPNFDKWRRFWIVPLWIGIGIAIIGGILMNWAYTASGEIGFWFFCASAPMLIGVLVIFSAYQSRTARWLHLRVQQAPGEKPQRIVLSFPLPLRLSMWFVRVFRHRIPQFQETNVDEILMAVDKTTSPDTPLYIEVDEGEKGEKVQIYIG
jgi:hypothetical protein